MTEKSEIEIAYNNATQSEFNQDMRNVYDKTDAMKFIPFFKMSDDISHLDDNTIISIILEMANLHRETYRD